LKSGGNEIAISPAFVKTTNSYTATVSFSEGTILTITPKAENANSTITVNGVSTESGTSVPVNLSIGPNSITVTVYYGGVVQQIYEINVFLKPEGNLSSLNVMSGSTNLDLSPSFSPTIQNYTAFADYDMSYITLTPTGSSTSTFDVQGSIVANGAASSPINLATGTNNIKVTVDDNENNKIIYSLEVLRHSSSYLTSCSLKAGKSTINYIPQFSRTKLSYTGTSLSSPITLSATLEDPAATINISVNGVNLVSSATTPMFTASVPLNTGRNNLIITVTSSSGQRKTYTFVINK
jgi:hypothetical protein